MIPERTSGSGGSNAERLVAICRRDFRVERSYQMRYLLVLFEFAVTGAVLFHIAELVDAPPELAGFRGGYFEFALVGLAVMSVARLGVGTFTQNITREQSLGTFEVLLATPTKLWVLLAGSFLFPLALTVVDLLVYFGVGIGLLGQGFDASSVAALAMTVPLLALTLANFCAFGIAGAALIVLAKRGDPFSGPLLQATTVLSGALFPISVLPAGLELAARAFPAYYGINGLREALLGGSGLGDVAADLAVLAAFSVVLVPLSLRIFAAAVASARRQGTLANY